MSNTLLLPSTFAMLVLVGILLLIHGLRGRRVGFDPHCKKCRYNLTGISADQCPECGSTILAETVASCGQMTLRVPLTSERESVVRLRPVFSR